MILRDYQHKAMEDVFEKWEQHRSTLCVLPTGTGKTVMFMEIAKRFPGRTMVIAHRDILIHQAVAHAEKAGQDADVEMGKYWAQEGPLSSSKILVSTVQTQTSGRRGSGRMRRFDPSHFDLLVVDEAHHSTAATYRRTIDYYRNGNPDLKVLGVTATPDRADEQALGQIYESVAHVYEIADAVQDGWLVPIHAQVVHPEGELDLSQCRTHHGDFTVADLERVLAYEQTMHQVIAPTLELVGDGKTLIFWPTKAIAERATEIINRHKAGSACYICDETKGEDRQQILTDYAEGKHQFLNNVGIATEGFDMPSIDAVVMARHTKSRALYAQMLGRGTRPLAGIVDGLPNALARRWAIANSAKPHLLLVDVAANTGNHKLITPADILGGRYNDAVVERAAKMLQATGEDQEVMSVLQQAELQLKAEAAEQAEANLRQHIKVSVDYSTKTIDVFDTLNILPGQRRGWDPQAPATQKQVDRLKKWGVENADELSKTHASQLIGEMIERFKTGKCTWKMGKLLKRYDYSPNLSMEHARKVIDMLKANGWRRPKQEVLVT